MNHEQEYSHVNNIPGPAVFSCNGQANPTTAPPATTAPATTAPVTTVPPQTTTSPGGIAAHYAQCGGTGYVEAF
jgi:hypothetical protein